MPITLQDYFDRFKDKLKPDDEVKKFFTSHSLSDYHLHLPYLIDIDLFCLRLLLAKLRQEKICIYSDYDTDAVTATATAFWSLIELGFDPQNVSFYAPDRFTEGYGMNVQAVEMLHSQNDLIVSVDCGINSVDEAERVNLLNAKQEHQCQLIITDHHQLNGDVPLALAVLNPQIAKHLPLTSSNSTSQSKFDSLINDVESIQPNLRPILNSWTTKLKQRREQGFEPLLSTSTTGVGVIWMCLVWLGYLFDEIEAFTLEK